MYELLFLQLLSRHFLPFERVYILSDIRSLTVLYFTLPDIHKARTWGKIWK